jgi:hypothetical protein
MKNQSYYKQLLINPYGYVYLGFFGNNNDLHVTDSCQFFASFGEEHHYRGDLDNY